MPTSPRLTRSRAPASWGARLGTLLIGALAVSVTIALLVVGFFIGLALLGLGALAALVFWLRRRLGGGARVARGRRDPVVIEGEYVVLSGSRSPPRD